MAELAEKLQGYEVRVHSNLKLVVILAKIEWATQQTWVTEISFTHHKIVTKYRYTHSHDTDSIRKVLRILATADVSQDLRRAKVPGELADMVSQEMKRLHQLVQQQPAPQYHSEISEERANSDTTTDRKGTAPRRGRHKQK